MEGSAASAAIKKTELKLANLAQASQKDLLEDYLSFLRQRNLPIRDAQSVLAQTVRQARPENLTQLRQLMACLVSDLSDKSDQSDKNALKQEVAANTMICLINQGTFLLARQISRLAADFKKDGGWLFYYSPRYSDPLFEVKNSEFSCEMKFRKSLHFYSEKLRMIFYGPSN